MDFAIGVRLHEERGSKGLCFCGRMPVSIGTFVLTPGAMPQNSHLALNGTSCIRERGNTCGRVSKMTVDVSATVSYVCVARTVLGLPV